MLCVYQCIVGMQSAIACSTVASTSGVEVVTKSAVPLKAVLSSTLSVHVHTRPCFRTAGGPGYLLLMSSMYVLQPRNTAGRRTLQSATHSSRNLQARGSWDTSHRICKKTSEEWCLTSAKIHTSTGIRMMCACLQATLALPTCVALHRALLTAAERVDCSIYMGSPRAADAPRA